MRRLEFSLSTDWKGRGFSRAKKTHLEDVILSGGGASPPESKDLLSSSPVTNFPCAAAGFYKRGCQEKTLFPGLEKK